MFYYNQFRIYIILPLSERLGKANYSHSIVALGFGDIS